MKTNSIKLKALGAAIGLVAAGGAVVSMSALADTYTVTAEIDNTITVTPGDALSLGTLAIAQGTSGGGVQAFRVKTDGTTTITGSGDATITELGGATPATFSVAGLGAFASINVSTITDHTAAPADPEAVFLVNSLAPPATRADLLITEMTIDPGTGTSAVLDAGDGTVVGTATVVAADVGGNASWIIGMEVSTVDPATGGGSEYYDGTYSGSYDITVSY